MVSSAFVTTYTKECTGTFGQPAPNARYHVHTVLLAREKRAKNPACKDTRASAQGGVCHRRSAGNRGNFQLFQCYVASQPGRVFFFFLIIISF